MSLYIRHSCCVKISLFQAKSTPLIHLRHHYSTHLIITQNLSIPYFISLFTILTKLFQLYILVTPLSHILLHKKSHTSQCDLHFPFLISQKERQWVFLILSNDLQNIFIRVKTHSTLGGLMKNESLIEFIKEILWTKNVSRI